MFSFGTNCQRPSGSSTMRPLPALRDSDWKVMVSPSASLSLPSRSAVVNSNGVSSSVANTSVAAIGARLVEATLTLTLPVLEPLVSSVTMYSNEATPSKLWSGVNTM